MGKLKYYCSKCKCNHFIDSTIGMTHIDYRIGGAFVKKKYDPKRVIIQHMT